MSHEAPGLAAAGWICPSVATPLPESELPTLPHFARCQAGARRRPGVRNGMAHRARTHAHRGRHPGHERLLRVRARAGLDESISVLRVFDVLARMDGSGNSEKGLETQSCDPAWVPLRVNKTRQEQTFRGVLRARARTSSPGRSRSRCSARSCLRIARHCRVRAQASHQVPRSTPTSRSASMSGERPP